MYDEILFIFDFETNGLKDCSVLSISFLIVQNLKILKKETRYYYPQEKYNYSAIKINGLCKETIDRYRKGVNYPKYFKGDHSWLQNIINKYNVKRFVAHNIAFDKKFLPKDILDKINLHKFLLFCTMNENKRFVNIIKNGKLKSPSLKETCEAYNIEFDTTQAHQSDYDTVKVYEVIVAMTN